MDDAPPPLINPATRDAAERSLVDDVKHLVADGRTLLEAELTYQKSRAAVAGAGIKGIAVWAALAIALVFFSLMALVIGVLIGLAQLLGIWTATGTLVVFLLICTGLAGLAAKRRWTRLSSALEREDAAP